MALDSSRQVIPVFNFLVGTIRKQPEDLWLIKPKVPAIALYLYLKKHRRYSETLMAAILFTPVMFTSR
jgi:hypothetical protein